MRAIEKEFSIDLKGGDTLKPGKYRFQVVNQGKIEHDLAIEGSGVEEKTPLIEPGEEAALEVDLKPGEVPLLLHRPGPRAVGHGHRRDGPLRARIRLLVRFAA